MSICWQEHAPKLRWLEPSHQAQVLIRLAEDQIQIAGLVEVIPALEWQLRRDWQAGELRHWRARMRRWRAVHRRQRAADIQLWRERQRPRGIAFALSLALLIEAVRMLMGN